MNAVTFTRTTMVYDESSGQMVPTVTTISGEAIIKSSGDPDRYRALELIQSSAPTLFFTPTAYPLLGYTDEFVREGDTVMINGIKMTVKDVQPIAPDGTVVAANIIVSV